MKKIFESFKTGIFVGAILSLVFSYINGEGNFLIYDPGFENLFNSKIQAAAVAIFLYGLIGVFSYLAAIIFRKVDNLLYATIFHYVVINIIILTFGYIFTWFDNLLSAVIMISIVYFVIYVVNYFFYKEKINKINNQIK